MHKVIRWINSRQGVFVLLLSLTAGQVLSQSQDWQALYNQALSKYQSEDFQNSLPLAKEAFQKAASVTPLNRAFTIQLITASCVALENADDGLQYIDEEIKLFQQIEGNKSKPLAEALKKQIVFFQQKNQVKLALEKSPNVAKSFADSYGQNATQTIQFDILWGDLALADGDSVKAKQLWNKCIPLLEGNPEMKEDYKTLLFNAAGLEENQKDNSPAVSKYSELIKLLEKENQTDDPIYSDSKKALLRLQQAPSASESSEIQSLLKKAIVLQSQNQNSQAIEIYRKCVEVLKQKITQDKLTFSVYLNYARLLIDQGSLQSGNEMLQKSRLLSVTLFKPGDFESFLIQLTEADLALTLGQKKDATTKYNLLISQVRNQPRGWPYLVSSCNQLLNNDIPTLVTRLLKPVVCCSEQNSTVEVFSKAAITYSEAMLASNKPDSALSFLNQPIFGTQLWVEFKKVEALQLLGQWQQALDELSKLKNLATTSDKEKGEIANHVARLAFKMGDYTTAEDNFLKAQKYFESVSQVDAWQVGNSLATLYSKLGNFEKSQKILDELLTKVPETNPLHLTLLSNLSANYIDTNELEKAKGIQEKIISIEKESIGEDHPDYAQAISNLAVLYQKERRYNDAKNLLEKALLISKNNFGEQSIDYALKESMIGAVLKDAGDITKSQSTLIHAEKVLSEKIGTSHPDYVSCEYNLAVVYLRAGDATKALPFMEHLAASYKKQILEFFPAMNEQEQVSFYNIVNNAVQDYQQFAVEYGNRYPELINHLLDFRLATKALLLNSSTRTRETIIQGSNAQLKAQFLSWISVKDQIGKLYSAGQSTSAADQITQLEEQANDLEKNLSQASAIFKKSKSERDVTWNKIQLLLQKGEAAVEFIRIKASGKSDSVSYAALVVRKDIDKPQLVVFNGGRKMEEREFSFYKNTIVHRLPNERSYHIFWKPLEAHLAGINKIYVSVDGVYNKMNLAALYDPQRKEFLNSKYQINLVSSLRDLIIESGTANTVNKTVQFFGPVNFSVSNSKSNSVYRSISETQLNSLPGTKTEIEKIGQVLKSAQWTSVSHLEQDASESALKLLAPTSVVHIATHGFFFNAADDEALVVMGSGRNDNPLFRSGLILSGSSTDDGVLTAYEVKNLNFDKTDLVVLSACETGLGEIRNSEGVYGLQRSFLISGVKNVLMSLWKVDDEATQELMVTFYQRLLTTPNKTEALHEAQVQLMKKYPDPVFWGSFVLISKPN